MAELILYESVSVAGVPTLVDGVELENSDLALAAKVAGLADDRVFSEFLRLMPTDGSSPVSRAIFPTGFAWYSQQYDPLTAGTPLHNVYATVAPTGSANGSVAINPFRALIGSRTAAGTNALDNWRDMRSAVFVGSATSLAATVPITANSSGNPRWDLVYAAVTVDAQQNSVQRRVKDPNSSAVSIVSVYQYLATTVSIQVVVGTPGASPAIPNVPGDSSSTFNVALGAVLVPNGWNSTSTVIPEQIRDLAPVITLGAAAGACTMRPASQQHDGIDSSGHITPGSYSGINAGTNFGWDVATPHRAPLFLPPGMVGTESRLVLMDFHTGGVHSHINGDLLDDSIDWRNRFFRVTAFVCSGELFASDPIAQAGTTPSIPFPLGLGNGRLSFGLGNSFITDGLFLSSYATIWQEANTILSAFETGGAQVAGGTKVGLLCNRTKGTLHAGVSGNPGCRVFLWIEASGQLANNVTAAP